MPTCTAPNSAQCDTMEACHGCPNAIDDSADTPPLEWIEETSTPVAWTDSYTPTTGSRAHVEAINAKQKAELEMESAALAHHRAPTWITSQALDHYATQYGRAAAVVHMYRLRSISKNPAL